MNREGGVKDELVVSIGAGGVRGLEPGGVNLIEVPKWEVCINWS